MKLGWGQADITPRGGKVSLRGQFNTRIADAVLDPLRAVALAVSQGEQTCVWVGMDLCGTHAEITREAARLVCEKLPWFQEEQLVLAATHIHTGPYTRRNGPLSLTGDQTENEGALTSAQCRAFVARGVADAVVCALTHMEEGYLELAVMQIITGVNRRTAYKDGTALMYGDFYTPNFLKMEGRDGGPTQVLYAYRASDRKLTGALVNPPCTAQCDEHAEYITADYWGVVREKLENAWGKDFCVLPLCRAAGDLSPHPMINRTYGLEKYYTGRECALRTGEWIAENLLSHRAKAIARYEGDVRVNHVWQDIELPVWPVSDAEYEDAKAYLRNPANFDSDMHPRNPFAYANAWTRKRRVEVDAKTVSTRLFTTRIGDVALASYPFELYIEYADRVRAAFQNAVIFDVELAHDSLGYLATPQAVAGGHYSANIFNGLCAPEGGEELVKRSIELVKRALQGE